MPHWREFTWSSWLRAAHHRPWPPIFWYRPGAAESLENLSLAAAGDTGCTASAGWRDRSSRRLRAARRGRPRTSHQRRRRPGSGAHRAPTPHRASAARSSRCHHGRRCSAGRVGVGGPPCTADIGTWKRRRRSRGSVALTRPSAGAARGRVGCAAGWLLGRRHRRKRRC